MPYDTITEGPWEWDTIKSNDDPSCLVGGDGNIVIRLEDQYPGYPECGQDLRMDIGEADMALIRSAHDLLSALEGVLKDHDERMRFYPELNSQPYHLHVMGVARDAVAKARRQRKA